MADVHVVKHWIVASFVPSEDPEENGPGTVGTVSEVYDTLADAQNAARENAANSATSVYVVYEATWYAHTDITPVYLRRVEAT
jgi:hypothetical protein